MRRAWLVTAASFAGSIGWGTVLPYQYAYVVNARHWGPTAGVLTGTLFCIGAVLATPIAGRLADRYSAGVLAVFLELLAGLSCVGMGLADSVGQFLGAMVVFGAAVTAANPASQVLLLQSIEAKDRRTVFAYQFTSLALGMAVGAFAAGQLVSLDSPGGMLPGFAIAVGGFVASAALTAAATRLPPVAPACEVTTEELTAARGGLAAYRQLFRNRQVRLLALVSMALAAGFYAQFETGLPAFALDSLHVTPSIVGTAAAVNCLVIVGVQWLVVRITGKHLGSALLIVVGAIWVATWLLLELALFTNPGTAGLLFVVAFGVFALGETMYAPVLGPLAAAVAPPGTVGTTLGALAALRTGFSAVGPLVAGLLIANHLPHEFVLLHVAINALAVVFAWRLLRAQRVDQRPAPVEVDNDQTDPLPAT